MLEDLLPHTILVDIAFITRVRVLELQTLIAVKEETAADKDKAILPLLRRVAQERKSS